ncbi:hypothetical protein [Methylocystis parvus]|uniref:hypothetical protein n=1 Tax=Methylocystis parvus TaxID=134 RepID=UPI003C774941
MKKTAILLSALLFIALPPAVAEAKGCIKGTLVGGVLGHYAGHHSVLGAIGGCLYGRHEANKSHARVTQQRQGWGGTYAHAPKSWRIQL